MKVLKYSVLLFCVFTFLITELNCQEKFVFKVILCKGDVNLVKNKKDTIKLSPGSRLTKNDRIVANGEILLFLLHNTGNTLELRKSGVFSVKKLIKRIPKAENNLILKYVSFLLKVLEDDSDEIKRFKLGVERAPDNEEQIQTHSPSFSKIYSDRITLRWKNFQNKSRYKFILSNNFNEDIFTTIVKDSSFVLDLSELKIDRGICYNWSVVVEGDNKTRSKLSCIYYVDRNLERNINKEISELLAKENALGSLKPLLLAKYFEKNELNVYAFENYLMAVEQFPEIEKIRDMFQLFMFTCNTARE